MSSAAAHSSRLLQEYEARQAAQADQHRSRCPSRFPFGGPGPGPFGGASREVGFGPPPCNTMAMKPSMTQFSELEDGVAGPPAQFPTHAPHWSDTPMSFIASRLQQKDISQYDYPAGWGAQTQTEHGVAGLTQDSASRIATLQAKLNQKLGPEYLSQRPGPGGSKKLTYIEGWKLIDLANEVFGFNGWSTSIVRLDVDYLDCSPEGTRFNAGVSCIIRVTLRDGAFHEDVGYGSAENAKQKHAAIEKCKKEAVTDATKRALKNFGKLLGNCTYDHSFTKEALKVPIPVQKFDSAQLHRRTDSRVPPPASDGVPNGTAKASAAPNVPVAAQPAREAMGPPAPPRPNRTCTAPAVAVKTASAAPTEAANGITNPSNGSKLDQGDGIDTSPAAPAAATSSIATTALEKKGLEEAQARAAAERLQKSQAARAAYLRKQLEQQGQLQGESRPQFPASASAAPASDSLRRAITGAPQRHQGLNGHDQVREARQHPRPRDPGPAPANSDEFGDESLDDALGDYDETDIGDAEAASMAVEMEIEAAAAEAAAAGDAQDAGGNSEHRAADDSGVHFNDDSMARIQVKKEKAAQHVARAPPRQESVASGAAVKPMDRPAAPSARRSLSPVKQAQQQELRPRRAGSVGRFLSPPEEEKGRTATASHATNGVRVKAEAAPDAHKARTNAGQNGHVGRGVEAGAGALTRRDAGRAVGRPVGHSYIAARGTKRSLEHGAELAPSVAQAPAGVPRQTRADWSRQANGEGGNGRQPLVALATGEDGSVKRLRP